MKVRINLNMDHRVKDIVLAICNTILNRSLREKKEKALPGQKQTGNFVSASHHHKQSTVLSLVPVQL